MKAVALLLLLAFPSSVFADELKHIPKWTMMGPKACYEFQDAKKLVELDSEFDKLLEADRLWRQINANLQESLKQTNLALALEKNISAELKLNGEQLTARLMTETARANKAEAKPGIFPAWAIAGGIGIAVGVIAGIVLGVYVAK